MNGGWKGLEQASKCQASDTDVLPRLVLSTAFCSATMQGWWRARGCPLNAHPLPTDGWRRRPGHTSNLLTGAASVRADRDEILFKTKLGWSDNKKLNFILLSSGGLAAWRSSSDRRSSCQLSRFGPPFGKNALRFGLLPTDSWVRAQPTK